LCSRAMSPPSPRSRCPQDVHRWAITAQPEQIELTNFATKAATKICDSW
jgi:hypothetical protein